MIQRKTVSNCYKPCNRLQETSHSMSFADTFESPFRQLRKFFGNQIDYRTKQIEIREYDSKGFDIGISARARSKKKKNSRMNKRAVYVKNGKILPSPMIPHHCGNSNHRYYFDQA